MALLTRFEFDIEQIPEEFLDVLVSYGILMIFVTLSVFAVFRIYSSLWEYAGLEETFKIIGAVVVSSLCDMANSRWIWKTSSAKLLCDPHVLFDRAGRWKCLQEERGFCRDCENT